MDGNKNVKPKRINIKNKKMATQALSKKANKKPSTKVKLQRKSPQVKHKVESNVKELNIVNIEPIATEETVVSQENKQVTKTTPKKEKVHKVTKVTKTQKKEPARKVVKVTKKKSAEKKTKLEIPKEWQEINVKKKKKEKEIEKGFTTKIKTSIFEELDDHEYKEKRKKEKEQFRKSLIIVCSVVFAIALIVFLLFKYNDHIRNQFTVYDVYHIGDKVKLSDETIWYVVDDDGEKAQKITLISEGLADINSDGQLSLEDEMIYNSENKSEYDEANESSVAKYLSTEYKQKLEERLGKKVDEVRLLTSKEFVNIRDTLGFGYEWTTGNWLAHEALAGWWIQSSQNNKVYAITSTGTYILYSPSTLRFVRPVIVLNKDMITLVEAQQPRVDGLLVKVKDFSNLEKKD